jgi:iron complex transport system ATP-binding protein
MSLHEIDLAHKVSDRVMCVKGDMIGRYGRPADIFTDEFINDLYDIKTGAYKRPLWQYRTAGAGRRAANLCDRRGRLGIPVYRELQRRGIPFAAGILP